MEQITLPVSLGEAIDKLTILDIKMSKISDNRRADVKNEYDILYGNLKKYVEEYAYYYKTLYKINLSLWELQDKFHGKQISDEEGGRICKVILLENDRRYRVKAKINNAAKSVLREQKGYDLKKVVLYSHLGLGDMYWMNGAVRYLATEYDEVLVVCKNKYRQNAEAMYADDPSIKLYLIDDDSDLYPWELKQHMFSSKGYKVLGCGWFSGKEKPAVYNLPQSFYDDIGIPHDIRRSYFYVPRTQEARELADMIKAAGRPYVLIHEESSVQTLQVTEYVKMTTTIPNVLLLDFNKNPYEKQVNPVEWELAEKVVGKPLVDYTYLIEGAHELYMIESSIYCLASHLDLSKVTKKVCYEPWGGNAERLGIFTTGPRLPTR
jgi:hypothetical protein